MSGWGWYAGTDSIAVSANQYDYQTIATNELGHAVGLEHSPSTNSAMYAALPTGLARRNFSAEDLAALADGVQEDEHENALTVALYAEITAPAGSRFGGTQRHSRAADLDLIVPLNWRETARSGDDFGRKLDGGSISGRYSRGVGHDVLIGGDGYDLLIGGSGRDMLVGGYGADRILGNAGEDLLSAGLTAHDSNDAAPQSIINEWTSADSYGFRSANVLSVTGLAAGNRLDGNDGATQTVFNHNDAHTISAGN